MISEVKKTSNASNLSTICVYFLTVYCICWQRDIITPITQTTSPIIPKRTAIFDGRHFQSASLTIYGPFSVHTHKVDYWWDNKYILQHVFLKHSPYCQVVQLKIMLIPSAVIKFRLLQYQSLNSAATWQFIWKYELFNGNWSRNRGACAWLREKYWRLRILKLIQTIHKNQFVFHSKHNESP